MTLFSIASRVKAAVRSLAPICLAVCLLWAGVAAPAYAADNYIENERGTLQSYERYDEVKPEVGGINRYTDTDPRRDTTAADAKAQALGDQAERSKRMADDPLEPTRKTLSNAGDYISDAVDEAKANVQDALD